MKQSELRDLIHGAPQRPVRICMDDGKRYTITHPDFALAAPDAVVLVSVPGHAFGASYVICGFEHISRVEVLDKSKAKQAKN
jgi:hypothetical protein